MSKEISYAEAIRMTELLKISARSDDKRFSNSVYYQHQDGSSCFYFGAYLVKLSAQWTAVITEHHGSRTVCLEDVHRIFELEQTTSESFKKTMKRSQKLKEKYEKQLAKANAEHAARKVVE